MSICNKIRVRLRFDMPPPLSVHPQADCYMFLINKSEMKCIADVEHAISHRFGFSFLQSLMLSIDKFFLMSSDDVDLIQENDLINVGIEDSVQFVDVISVSSAKTSPKAERDDASTPFLEPTAKRTKHDPSWKPKKVLKSKKEKLKKKKKKNKSAVQSASSLTSKTRSKVPKVIFASQASSSAVECNVSSTTAPEKKGKTNMGLRSHLLLSSTENPTNSKHKNDTQIQASLIDLNSQEETETSDNNSLVLSEDSDDVLCSPSKMEVTCSSDVEIVRPVIKDVKVKLDPVEVKQELIDDFHASNNIQKSQSNNKTTDSVGPSVKDYDSLNVLSWPPRIGDIIAFKQLEMTDNYCPCISGFKEGKILEVFGGTVQESEKSVLISVMWPETEEKLKSKGKFDLDYGSDEEEEVIPTTIGNFLQWDTLIDPRLIK